MQGAPGSDGKTFFGLHQYLAGRCCENLQVAGTPRSVNLAHVCRLVGETNTWLIGIIVVPFYNNNSPPPHQFLHEKTLLKKKLAWGNAH